MSGEHDSHSQPPRILRSILISVLLVTPYIGAGYAAAKYGHLWLLAAAAWHLTVGVLCSYMPDEKDES